jgi:hypothetical protein
VRVAAAGLAAIIAALALALNGAASADQANPFPSPSPVATQAPGAGGYAVISILGSSASGGIVPGSASPSPTPMPFGSSGATGYSVEIVGRLSPSYFATLRYEDAKLHSAPAAYTTRFDIAALYQFGTSRAAAGIGFASIQQSTLSSSANGFGTGFMLLPNFATRVSPYASAFLYPALTAPGGVRGGLTVLRLGITLTPPHATGVFARLGFTAQHFSASTFSPTSLTGAELGFGTTF